MKFPRKYVTVTAGSPCAYSFADTEGYDLRCMHLLFLRPRSEVFYLEKKSVNGRLLRCGYTTGSCAAAAAKAATLMLIANQMPSAVTITTPTGATLTLDILDTERTGEAMHCAVKKDSGDDPDITNGIFVYAEAEKAENGIHIQGGLGIGRVTKPGLDQPVGAFAINSVPRRMITGAVEEVCAAYAYQGGICITLSIPEGEALATHTFNPRMGIEGGLSIIGTTGIVEPMSSKALIDTIRLELKQLIETGAHEVLFTPGNYGEAFAENTLQLSLNGHVACSNFIGDAIDAAIELGFERILLVGHIGKLVKLGIGAMNTHSSSGDGRMETLIACALAAGADLALLHGIADCVSTDTALSLIYDAGLLEECMAILGARINECLARRVPQGVTIGFVCFTNADAFGGVLTESENAQTLMKLWRESV